MSTFGIDFAWGRPTVASLKAAGVKFVVRYVGSTNHTSSRDGKWLDKAEVARYRAAGLDIAVVFETGAGRANGGRSAGLADAKTAQADIEWLGFPKDLPVYFAVDQDDTVGPLIAAYYGALGEVLGKGRVGCYAGIKIISALFDKKLITYGWQTYAWSGGKWDSRAQLQQYSNEHKVGGVDSDYDRAMATDFGQWKASGSTPTPAPAPKPPVGGSLKTLVDLGLTKGQIIPKGVSL